MEYRQGAIHTVMYQATKQSLTLQNSSFPKYFIEYVLEYFITTLKTSGGKNSGVPEKL